MLSFIIHPRTTCQGNGTTHGELDSLILSNNQNNTYQGLPIIQSYLKNSSIEIPFYINSRCEKLKIKANKYREHLSPVLHWLLQYFFCPSVMITSLKRIQYDIHLSFLDEYSIDIFSLHFEKLLVSVLFGSTVHWKNKFLWWELKAAFI